MMGSRYVQRHIRIAGDAPPRGVLCGEIDPPGITTYVTTWQALQTIGASDRRCKACVRVARRRRAAYERRQA